MSLFVVYTPSTSHVVGAVNAIGITLPADAKADVLVGPQLPLRVTIGPGEIATLPLAAGDLAVHAPDDQPEVFAGPLAFGVVQVPSAKPKPALTALKPWDDPDLAFTVNSLVVTMPVESSEPTPVLVLVAVEQSTRVLTGTIGPGEDSIELGVAVSAGTYGVLALVAGWEGILMAVTRT